MTDISPEALRALCDGARENADDHDGMSSALYLRKQADAIEALQAGLTNSEAAVDHLHARVTEEVAARDRWIKATNTVAAERAAALADVARLRDAGKNLVDWAEEFVRNGKCPTMDAIYPMREALADTAPENDGDLNEQKAWFNPND